MEEKELEFRKWVAGKVAEAEGKFPRPAIVISEEARRRGLAMGAITSAWHEIVDPAQDRWGRQWKLHGAALHIAEALRPLGGYPEAEIDAALTYAKRVAWGDYRLILGPAARAASERPSSIEAGLETGSSNETAETNPPAPS